MSFLFSLVFALLYFVVPPSRESATQLFFHCFVTPFAASVSTKQLRRTEAETDFDAKTREAKNVRSCGPVAGSVSVTRLTSEKEKQYFATSVPSTPHFNI